MFHSSEVVPHLRNNSTLAKKEISKSHISKPLLWRCILLFPDGENIASIPTRHIFDYVCSWTSHQKWFLSGFAICLQPLLWLLCNHCSKHRQEAGQTLRGLQPQHTLSWLRHRPPPHSHLLGSQIFFQQTFNKWTVTSKNFLYIWYFFLEFATSVIRSFSSRKIIYSILFSLEIFLTSRSLNLPWVPIPFPHPDHSFFSCSTQSLCIYLTDTFNTHPSLCHIKASNIQW